MRFLVFGLLLSLLLAGCGRIAVVPEPLPPTQATISDIDVAVVSVDFDPALQGNQLPVSEHYAVLVAVENRGRQKLVNIAVQAVLSDATSKREVLQGMTILPELAPGAMKVVTIKPTNTLPPVPAQYRLLVQALPLPGETTLANNTRTFTITVAR